MGVNELQSETEMGPLCYREKYSDPPACGVHGVLLAESAIPIDDNAPHLGHVVCYVCPVSSTVAQDSERTESKTVN